MPSEERINSKDIAARILPHVQRLRADLETNLISLAYLEQNINNAPMKYGGGWDSLLWVRDNLKKAEETLCRI